MVLLAARAPEKSESRFYGLLRSATALLMVCLGCSGEKDSVPEKDSAPTMGAFSALTYNVAGLPMGISDSQPDIYTPLISPLLNAYDLVLVQEDFFYHEELIGAAEHAFRSEPLETEGLVGDGLNRLSRFAFADLHRQRWEECNGKTDSGGDCLAEKGFSVARHELAEGVFADVYNFHMDAGNDENDQQARSDQVDQLLAKLAERAFDGPLILGGDTNLKPEERETDGPSYERLVSEAGLTDACRALDCGDEQRVDRFFYRDGERISLEATSWTVAVEFTTEEGKDLSDHEAVAVEFAWERTK